MRLHAINIADVNDAKIDFFKVEKKLWQRILKNVSKVIRCSYDFVVFVCENVNETPDDASHCDL